MTVDTFTSGSGTYTCLAAGTLVIEGYGAGAAPTSAGSNAVNGGYSGAYGKKTLTVTAGQTFGYSIGSGGISYLYSGPIGGQAGGATTVTNGGTTYTAGGGILTAGGAATGWDTNTSGTAGAIKSGNLGGAGGSAPGPVGGAGGAGGLNASNGGDGTAPGGAGGGMGKSAYSSGQGAPGRAIFTLTPSGGSTVSRRSLSLRTRSRGVAN